MSKLTSAGVAVALLISTGGASSFAADTGSRSAQTVSAAAAATESILMSMPAGKYRLDKGHAYLNFSYSHLGFSTPTIGFRNFDANLNFDQDNVANSSLDVTIDVNSIDSRVAKFDKHLVGEDMFDTDKFPTATFTSTSFVMTSANAAKITGDLTIKDTTRAVTLDATINKAANHPMMKVPTFGVSATTTFKRSEFGIDYAAPHVGDDITVSIEVEMPQAK